MKSFETSAKACIPARSSKIIFDIEKVKLVKDKHPVLILGFLGSGLVGDIVANEMIDQLNMEQIGFVTTEFLPAIAVFKNGILQYPFRLYYSQEKNVVVALCEIPFNTSDTYSDLARLISNWSLEISIDEICVIQGLAEEGLPQEHPVYLAAEKEIVDRIMTKGGMEVLPRGIIMGPEAALLNEGLNNQLNCYALLTPVNARMPDPGAAAVIIKVLNKIYEFELESKKLEDESEEITKKLMELNLKTEQQHSQMISLKKPDSNTNLYL